MDEPTDMPFGIKTRVRQRNHVSGGAQSPQGKGQFWGSSGPLKCIRQPKQQKLQQHGAADMYAGDSTSQRKRGFRMDSPIMWVTSGGSDAAFRQHSLTTNN